MSDVVHRARGRCAVVYNPTKIGEQFREVVEKVIQRDGWVDTLWLETSAEDPGRAMTRMAVSEHIDLVVGAGSDGTVLIVADGWLGYSDGVGSCWYCEPAGLQSRPAAIVETAAIEVAFDGYPASST